MNKFIVNLQIACISFLYLAALSNNHQLENYAGGIYCVIGLLYAVKGIILFFLAENAKEDVWAENMTDWYMQWEKSKDSDYHAVCGYIAPLFVFLGLSLMYGSIYVGSFYIAGMILSRVAVRHIERERLSKVKG